MSNKIQAKKNIELTEKLTLYLLSSKAIKLPSNVSIVPFSSKDKKLNQANEKLLEVLASEDKPVVKAEEPTISTGSWKFTPVNF